jgi:ATP-dependent Clp protease ATP-binding subunit ClpC
MQANFTPRCQEILALSKRLAEKYRNPQVTVEHVFLAFLKVDSFLFPRIKSELSMSLDSIVLAIEDSLAQKTQTNNKVVFGEDVKSALDLAYQISNEKQHSYISVEHLFYALLNDPSSCIIDYLVTFDIDIIKLDELVKDYLDNTEHNDNISFSYSNGNTGFTSPQSIELYSIDMNDLARQGEFDYICANPTYVNAIEETLCRKTKSCVLLIGDPGIGKTALVENLAKRIVDLQANDYLSNKRVLSLDLPSMVAGTKYRGQFEERLKSFIDAVKLEKNIILFIDEIHTIVGAGNAEGSLDAANIIKPYIARGELTCIGATTFEEYKKSIDKDPALRRRFNNVKMNEPTDAECLKILQTLLPSYEAYHSVNYSTESIIESIKLSNKFISNKKLPDKAIDLLDQAGSIKKIKHFKKPLMAKKMEKVLIHSDVSEDIKRTVYENYKDTLTQWGEKKMNNPVSVTALDIQKIISGMFDISLDSLKETRSTKLTKLESRISKDVIGQNNAVEKLVNSLFKNHSGLQDPNRPIGSFLFLGKTGTGKTLTSKALARHYFGSDKKLNYFDMSEFSDATSVSKFSGSSPGYVGYEKGGILTEKIKHDPHCVLLFDEIEKAHPIVLQSLLQILEEGRMTDNSGEETSFKNTIIILTSNLGADIVDKGGSVGFLKSSNDNYDKIFEEAKRKLSPELVNRFDGIILFNNFSEDHLSKIITLELNKVRHKLKQKSISVKFKPNVKKYILEKTIHEKLGARPIRRIIQNELEVVLAKFIIMNEDEGVTIDCKDNTFICNGIQTTKATQSNISE